jgi:hypothetical protein
MPRPVLPPWLRRGLEAAVAAAVVAIISLAGDRLGSGDVVTALPEGPAGALLLAPAVVALGVLPAAYPIAMAATRSDALMGAMAGWLLAVDFTLLFSGGQISLDAAGLVIRTGLLVGILSLVAVIAGMVASQLGASFGFGRRAGALAAVAAAVAAGIALIVVSILA